MSPLPQSTPIEVLLVEDDPGDVLMIREAFQEKAVANRLSVVGDGEQASDFLHHRGEHADAPRPDLILLDLNLPRKDGRELLAEVKGSESLRCIPVVVLTHLRSRRGHPAQLPAARQRLCHQAGRLRSLRRRDASDRRFLRLGGQATRQGGTAMSNIRQAVFELLREQGMTTVFGNPGSTELPILTEFPGDFRYVLGLQEAAASGSPTAMPRPAVVRRS